VRLGRDTRPAVLALLIPVARDVVAIELRRGGRRLARLERPVHRPSLQEVSVDAGNTLHWSYHHPDGGRPEISVALRSRLITTAVLAADACLPSEVLPLWRFQPAGQIVVSASDGWNVTERQLDAPPESPGPVIIRRLGDGRFWADVPRGWGVTWSLDGGHALGDDRVVRPPALRQPDRLVLEATAPGGHRVTDFLSLEATAR
jgi:hypothetical protein